MPEVSQKKALPVLSPSLPASSFQGFQRSYSPSEKQRRLEGLMHLVQGCRACPRMEGRARVLTNANGKAWAKVIFVAEAPGRLGADRTCVPLHGDISGNNFETLIAGIGWTREKIFVTNAVLCNPRGDDGNNATPNDQEMLNCSYHLEHQIQIIRPLVIATLGASALKALALIEPHEFRLGRDVASPQVWGGRIVFPLYHPSPRAVMHRNLAKQAKDYQALKELVERI